MLQMCRGMAARKANIAAEPFDEAVQADQTNANENDRHAIVYEEKDDHFHGVEIKTNN